MNRKEYNQCVENFADSVYRFLLKACHNKTLAEDLVQDSFLILWENVGDIAYEKGKAYLFTTAYRKMIDTFRREKKNADIETVDPTGYFSETDFSDIGDVLELALNRLSPIQKTVVLLRDYESYSYKEIADITALTETQVKVYIFRARHLMQEFIRKPNVII